MAKKRFADPELTSVHSVKILLCYLLEKLDRAVSKEQLLEISQDSKVIDYFCFSEALDGLITAGAVSEDESGNIRLEKKGRLGSEYFNKYIPLPFRRSILSAAYSYFSRIRRAKECSCEISRSDNGFTVSFSIEDTEFSLMKMSLYAPDEEAAENIAEKIKCNPSGFYMNVVKLLLENPEEKQDFDV